MVANLLLIAFAPFVLGLLAYYRRPLKPLANWMVVSLVIAFGILVVMWVGFIAHLNRTIGEEKVRDYFTAMGATVQSIEVASRSRRMVMVSPVMYDVSVFFKQTKVRERRTAMVGGYIIGVFGGSVYDITSSKD